MPNGVGGFASVSGVATAAGGGPDLAALATWVGTNLGSSGLVMGNTASQAVGANTIAIGNNAKVRPDPAGLINKPTLSPVNGIAIGANSTVGNENGIALGNTASANRRQSIAIGNNAQVLWDGSTFGDSYTGQIAIGNGATVGAGSGSGATVVGSGATSDQGNLQTALGASATVRGNITTALGAASIANGDTAAAVGVRSQASGYDSIAYGTDAIAGRGTTGGTVNAASSVGVRSAAQGGGSTAVGTGAYVFGNGSGAIAAWLPTTARISAAPTNDTSFSIVGGTNNFAIGNRNLVGATSTGNVAFGNDIKVGASGGSFTEQTVVQNGITMRYYVPTFTDQKAIINSVAIGQAASVTANEAVAVGNKAAATGASGIAIGNGATTAVGAGNIAIGEGAKTTAVSATLNRESIAVGQGATADGLRAVSLGTSALANGNSLALGYNAQANGGGSTTAIGYGARANGGYYALAVGQSANATGQQSTALGSGAASSGLRAVAIGNGAQAVGEDSISIGTGNIVTGARSGAIGDPSFINADDSYAIGNNNTIAVGANQSFVLGNNVTVNNSNNVVLGNASADKAFAQVSSATIPGVIATMNADGTVTYAAGPAVTYGGFAGTATGVVSVGAAGAERQIVNVAPGAITATSTDAINGSQLYSVASQVNTLGGNITNIVNNASSHFYSVNGGTSTDGNYANNGATAVGAIASGINASATAANAVAMGTGATAGTANSVALGAGSTTTAATPTASATIRGTTYNFAGANPAGVVSVGSAGAERQIQNVAAGQLSATSTDAINGSQLYATNLALETISAVAGAGINVTTAATGTGIAIGTSVANVGPGGTATYTAGNNMVLTQNGANTTFAVNDNPNFNSVTVGGTSITNTGVSIAGGPSMTTSGVDAGGKPVTNVAPGVNGTDAVNMNQLNAGIGAANQNVNQLRNDVVLNRREANAGTAGAMAMAGMPQAYLPGKSMLAAGVAAYEGQTAIAIGVSKLSDNGKWVMKFTGSANSRGNVGVAAGAGFHW
ncbi:MAG: hypothetical protein EOP81_10180 [Variovorax sp.]|nr:MAG: hypothetical protein EOP81_10180 [Variovorax sp.]